MITTKLGQEIYEKTAGWSPGMNFHKHDNVAGKVGSSLRKNIDSGNEALKSARNKGKKHLGSKSSFDKHTKEEHEKLAEFHKNYADQIAIGTASLRQQGRGPGDTRPKWNDADLHNQHVGEAAHRKLATAHEVAAKSLDKKEFKATDKDYVASLSKSRSPGTHYIGNFKDAERASAAASGKVDHDPPKNDGGHPFGISTLGHKGPSFKDTVSGNGAFKFSDHTKPKALKASSKDADNESKHADRVSRYVGKNMASHMGPLARQSRLRSEHTASAKAHQEAANKHEAAKTIADTHGNTELSNKHATAADRHKSSVKYHTDSAAMYTRSS